MAIVQGTLLYAPELTWNGRVGMEGGYQRAINRMGRTGLGVFKSTPTGIVTAESGLTRARALPDQGSPEKIPTRDKSDRLRAATVLRPGEPVEKQEWSQGRAFPGTTVVDEKTRL